MPDLAYAHLGVVDDHGIGQLLDLVLGQRRWIAQGDPRDQKDALMTWQRRDNWVFFKHVTDTNLGLPLFVGHGPFPKLSEQGVGPWSLVRSAASRFPCSARVGWLAGYSAIQEATRLIRLCLAES